MSNSLLLNNLKPKQKDITVARKLCTAPDNLNFNFRHVWYGKILIKLHFKFLEIRKSL